MKRESLGWIVAGLVVLVAVAAGAASGVTEGVVLATVILPGKEGQASMMLEPATGRSWLYREAGGGYGPVWMEVERVTPPVRKKPWDDR